MGIDTGGDADVGVAQKLLDHDEIDALLQERVCTVSGVTPELEATVDD
ncbi:hypothetical protein GCM10010294_48690 [Streptomyces griseoloalbus]|nr:hypothetical protein GCM10010294_48690 [Streptomyces griseoloalbus]